MAVQTEIWLKAHIRLCFAQGLTCAVIRRGASEAGMVIVIVRMAADSLQVYMPAPGPVFDESGNRQWYKPDDGRRLTQDEVDRFVARQIAVDPDIWILEIDDPEGTGLLLDKAPMR